MTKIYQAYSVAHWMILTNTYKYGFMVLDRILHFFHTCGGMH